MNKLFLKLLLFLLPVLQVWSQPFVPPPRTTLASPIRAGSCIVVKEQGKVALLDRNLNRLLPPLYDKIRASDPYILVTQGTDNWFYHADGYKLSKQAFPGDVSRHLAGECFLLNTPGNINRQGIVCADGTVTVAPSMHSLGYIGGEYVKFTRAPSGDWGVVNFNGEIIFGDSLASVEGYGDGLIAARQKGSNRVGYLDVETKEWAIAPQFPNAYAFEDGIARVNDNGYHNAVAGVNLPLNWRWGLIDKSGDFVLEYTYAEISPFKESPVTAMSVFEQDNQGKYIKRVGLIDRSGKVILPPTYISISIFESGYAIVNSAARLGIIDTNGKVVLPPEYSRISPASEGIHICVLNGKTGAVTIEGKPVVPFQYESADNFRHGVSWMKRNNRYYLVNSRGEEVVSTKTSALPVSVILPDRAYVQMENTHFLITDKGKLLKELPYDQVGNIKDGLATVKVGSLFGFINIKGEEVVSPIAHNVIEFSEGLAAVQATNASTPYFINTKGEKLSSIAGYVFYGPFSEGLAKAFINVADWFSYYPDYRLGYVNKMGKQQFVTNFNDGGNFENGYAAVARYAPGDTLIGLVDTSGKIILPAKYKTVGVMGKDGLIAIQEKSGLWGYADRSGAVVITPQYEDASDFLDGVAIVRKAGKMGLIDRQNKIVVDFIYNNARSMNNTGFIPVKKGDLWGAIDAKGKVVADFKYDQLSNMQDGVAWARYQEKWGLLDAKKNWKEVPGIKDARGFVNGQSVVTNEDGLTGVIDKSGKVIIPFVYNVMSDIYDGVIIAMQSKGYQLIITR